MTVHATGFGAVEALEWGDGDELLVLLHAAASGPWGLADLAERLLRPGRRVVAPALAGYGGTRVEGAADPVAAHVTVARWTLAAFPARRRVLFGHSLGGLTALLAAAGRDDLAALVLFEPIVLAALDPEDPGDRALADGEAGLIAGIRAAVAAGAPEPGVAAFVEAWNEVRWPDLPAKLRARLLADAGRLADETEAVTGRRIPDAAWATVAVPATVLYGDRSPALAARMAQRLAARLPVAEARCLPAVGHMGPSLAAGAMAAAIAPAMDRP